ncbi:Holo-[acyl-carrier-protein] synthase [Buchnera aphidicola (Eriosoma lanigerum)]|uniref:holo-ACP synthase n=1 Tax=Buchnera aphidicola TaxID=9 RepID=UPI0034646D42
MNIFGIGIDTVSFIRIEKIFKKFKYKFAQRILSINEFKELIKKKNKIAFLSNRFAVKEATVKAFGTGIRHGICFNQIELIHNELGKPEINLLKLSLQLFIHNNLKSIHVSLSNEKLYTCAIVIIEK